MCLFLNIFFFLLRKIDNLKERKKKKLLQQQKEEKKGKKKRRRSRWRRRKIRNVKIHTAMLSSRNAFSRDLLYSSSLSFIFFTIFFSFFSNTQILKDEDISLYSLLILFFVQCFIKEKEENILWYTSGVFLFLFSLFFCLRWFFKDDLSLKKQDFWFA